MIIAFYPGAGGNRYLRMCNKLEWQKSNCTYDATIHDQKFVNRYLLELGSNSNQSYVLTHCLNTSLIKKNFLEHEIVFILGDLKACLKREWAVAGHQRFSKFAKADDLNRIDHYRAFKDDKWPECNLVEEIQALPSHILSEVMADYKKISKKTPVGTLENLEKQILSKVNSAFEIITWHKSYYESWPVEIYSGAKVVDITNDNSEFCSLMRSELDIYHSDIFDEVWKAVYDQN